MLKQVQSLLVKLFIHFHFKKIWRTCDLFGNGGLFRLFRFPEMGSGSIDSVNWEQEQKNCKNSTKFYRLLAKGKYFLMQ